MIKKAIRKYLDSPSHVKAAAWYTTCIFLQKLAAFLIIPFLTRILSTNEYGIYAAFLSWMSVLEILATMRMYGNGYVAGLVRNSKDQERYVCSVQFTCLTITSIVAGIAMVFSTQISQLINLREEYILPLLISFYPTAIIGLWSAKQRVNNKYKLMVFITLLYSVLAPICSLIAAYLMPNKLMAVIKTRVYIQFLVALPFFLSNTMGAGKRVFHKYCKEILLVSLPLVPYYLSMVVLNSFDRIMIKDLVGESQAAMYSVAYSLAMTMFVFEGALNMALEPWLLERIKNRNGDGVSRTLSIATCFIASMNLIILFSAPELIRIIAPNEYAEAAWAMPPVIASLLVMFMYQQVLQINFFFGETKVLLVSSIFSAILNIVLNRICLIHFGYIAAGYTTLVSYMLISVLCYCSMVRVSNRNHVEYKEYYSLSSFIGIFIIYSIITAIAMLLYPHILVRYTIVSTSLIIAVVFRKAIINFFKTKELTLI